MKFLTPKITVCLVGLISGAAIQLNWMSSHSVATDYGLIEVILRLLASAVIFPFIFLKIHLWILNSSTTGLNDSRVRQLEWWGATSFIPTLIVVSGVAGVVMTAELVTAIIAAMITINLLGHLRSSSQWSLTEGKGSLGLLFLISGFAALIYQVAWQRTLFATFGINMESVAMVVSVFMFGLGIGSLIGGALCTRFPNRLRELFLICEAAIGLFGLASIAIIRVASDVIIHGNMFSIGLTIFAILCLPTIMMGATLPILVTHINQSRQNIGNSVGWMYFFNTIGSALAALLTVLVIFPAVGLQNAVWIAALLNFIVAGLVFVNARSGPSAVTESAIST